MRHASWVILLFATFVAGCQTAPPTHGAAPPATLPRLRFADPQSQALYGAAYEMALDNVFRINTVEADARHRASGLLQGQPARMVRAGGGYPDAWTRDASINSWNALNLLSPDLARNTLFAVVDRDSDGYVVRQDNQQWDQAIWIIAAWQQFLVTGDRDFLARAFAIADRTLRMHREKAFDPASGLFLGPSVINDGISGYPEPVADAGETRGSFVLDYPASQHIAALSTNAVHQAAYRSAAKMAGALGLGERIGELDQQANTLGDAIQRAFLDPATGTYRYLYAPGMQLETAQSQEGLGLSFLILFRLTDPSRTDALIAQAKVSPWGMPDVSPAFARYDAQHPGRHNAIVWPMIQGFWGSALAERGDAARLGTLVKEQATLALRSGGFYEIYNADTGNVDGGWQTGHVWTSEKDQTWSASAYLRLIDDAVFGLHAMEDGLHVTPVLPPGMGAATLEGVRYRAATLTVSISGEGARVTNCRLDDGDCPQVLPPSLSGPHRMSLTLVP